MKKVITLFLLLLDISNYGLLSVHGFVQVNNPTVVNKDVVSSIRARPTAMFDLDAIEKFEEEQLLKMNTGEEEEKLDDDDFMDDDNDNIVDIEIKDEDHNKRIDAVISKAIQSYKEMSRTACGSLVIDGHVQLIKYDDENKKSSEVLSRKGFKVERGTMLRVKIPMEEEPHKILAQKLPLSILYEDEYMIVLNKANGMVVHPAVGNRDGTVVNALAYYLANESPHGNGEFINTDGTVRVENSDGISIEGTDGEVVTNRPGIVHRLDKGTTGVLVVAKTRAALAALSQSFKDRKVEKTYLAITVGNPGRLITINKPIGRHPKNRQCMRVVPDPHKRNSGGFAPKDRMQSMNGKFVLPPGARHAKSLVNTVAFDGKLSVVEVKIETGRKHQIRVHLQHRHTPVYGDDMYGIDVWNKRLYKVHQIQRPLLHAYSLKIRHPITDELMHFTSPLPADMDKISTTIWPQGKEERPDLFTTATD
mmetsp:Transcript_19167/g.21911  ORF Transcript_19167/g.21911 Transcript_19167/m.21911 type:complete len:477 (+) Transcript_19167:79-1509(+)